MRIDGEHYHTRGVHPGPAPAHEVEISIGAIGPKMLALSGRLGDGWLPSQAYVPPHLAYEERELVEPLARFGFY